VPEVDGYNTYYAERLWQLLPAVYRSVDPEKPDQPGPLRELINRIGVQVAVVRRSIDRMWADQSIETCDDWVIPYIGDLLGTNLVHNIDSRAQRLDVAKTIHYRRRKGTLEVLEELALDVTGWTAHVVEGFRRLARTRHSLDPAVGPAAYPAPNSDDFGAFLQAQSLAGLLTGGLVGGLADLRSCHGAALANTAFDESFHMADFRAGRGALGHFGIPKLLVFLWRLTSFAVTGGTPVRVGQSDQYVFDPTGRQNPLFLPAPTPLDDFSASWTPAREWQVPGPLTASLETAIRYTGPSATTVGISEPVTPARPPYPRPVSPPPLLKDNTDDNTDLPARYGSGPGWQIGAIWPEIGLFEATATESFPKPLTVDYHYGFSSTIGAGPYDRTLLGEPPAVFGTETPVAGGTGLDTALSRVGPTGTLTIRDSLTYSTLASVGSSAQPIEQVLVRAGSEVRPVLRPAPGAAAWIFTGRGDAQLVLDGLTLSGCDIILCGSFKTVQLTACTIDPGSAADGAPPIATAVDGTPLAPSRIFIEADPTVPPAEAGTIRQLLVDHCILGPVRTRLGGSVETFTITDSIVQGLPATTGPKYIGADIFDPLRLADGLLADGPVSTLLRATMPAATATDLQAFTVETPSSQQSGLPPAVLDALNALVDGPSLYDRAVFATVDLSAETRELAAVATTAGSAQVAALNRALIDESFPIALEVAALAVADATVQLSRATVLGRIAAHRLFASDCILHDFAAVNDVQEGCVRFSAYASGSTLPRQYESAAIPPEAPIFTSTSYGDPGYAQLLETADTAIAPPPETADTAIVPSPAKVSISAGAENRSEMGAFSADLNPLKEQGLLIKYAEYMPLGLTPVIVHVT
jgi:hypothetical protein